MSQTGPEHSKTFSVRAVWEGVELGKGTGKSKKQAETAAAIEAMRERRWEKNSELVGRDSVEP
jgi:ribonuclease-3